MCFFFLPSFFYNSEYMLIKDNNKIYQYPKSVYSTLTTYIVSTNWKLRYSDRLNGLKTAGRRNSMCWTFIKYVYRFGRPYFSINTVGYVVHNTMHIELANLSNVTECAHDDAQR